MNYLFQAQLPGRDQIKVAILRIQSVVGMELIVIKLLLDVQKKIVHIQVAPEQFVITMQLKKYAQNLVESLQ